MFLGFFYALRAQGIRVTPIEWLGVCEVLLKHPAPSASVLYHVARALCVKDEALYDLYDRIFAEAFGDGSAAPQTLSASEAFLKAMSEGSLAELQRLGFDVPPELAALLAKYRDSFADVLAASPEDKPGGIRTGEAEGLNSALRIAGERRFKNYRSDLTLDTRSIRVALSRLRRLIPEGPRDELDLTATIAESGRNGGEIDLIFRRRKKNRVKLVLLMDAGGTMTPHAQLVSRLFSAAKAQFQELRAYYFHNCPYQEVYHDIARRKAVPTDEVLRLGDDHWLLVVGDAHMNGMELIRPGGAIEGPRNAEPGMVWLQRLQTRFAAAAWLNPYAGASDSASNQSVWLVQSVFDMFPLSVDGLDAAVRHLLSGKKIAVRRPEQVVQAKHWIGPPFTM